MNFVGLNLWRAYCNHLKSMMLPFQAIFEDWNVLENVRLKKYRFNYLFPLIFLSGITIDSVISYARYGLETEELVYFHWFIHRFMSSAFLRQCNLPMIALHSLSFSTHLCLIADDFSHLSFVMFLSKDSSRPRLIYPYRKPSQSHIDLALSDRLIKSYSRFRQQVGRFVLLMRIEMHSAFVVSTVLVSGYQLFRGNYQYICDIRAIIYGIGSFFYFDYFILAFQTGIEFLGQNRVMQKKQNFYSCRMNKLLAIRDVRFLRWRRIMENILDITREILIWNRFLSKYVTLVIIITGILFCLVTHISLTADMPIIQKIVWNFCGFLYLCQIAILNASSSRTIFLNVSLFKKLRQLQIKLLATKKLTRYQIVKLDLVNEYKLLLLKCSFRLLNSSMINNKLFAFTICGSISVFYMKLISKQWI